MDVKKIIKELLVRSYTSLFKDNGGKVIYYHDVSKKYTDQGTPMKLFIEHINVLKNNGFTIVSDLPKNRKEVMICFDDGWKGIWDERQYFIENGIYPTIFLINDYIGKTGYLSKDEIADLQSKGFRFQAHTFNHVNVTEISKDEYQHEFCDSRIELSKLTGKEVNEFCFPRGEYSDELVAYALSHGYKKVYICTPGNANFSDCVIKRNLVQTCSRKEFFAILNGGLKVLAKHAENLHHK